MKILLISCAIIVSLLASAQKQDDYIKYYQYASEGDFFFYSQQFDSAVVYFDKAMHYVKTPHPSQLVRYAQSLWKLDRK